MLSSGVCGSSNDSFFEEFSQDCFLDCSCFLEHILVVLLVVKRFSSSYDMLTYQKKSLNTLATIGSV